MSILDELKKMARPYDEDEDMLDDEMDLDEDYGGDYAAQPQPQYQPQPQVQVQPQVQAQPQQMNMGAAPVSSAPAMDIFGAPDGMATAEISKYRVILIQPEQFDCATTIADSLRKGDAVILNCENTDPNIARRVVDFLSGCAYAIDGDIKKAAQDVYIITPSDVGVDEADEG